MMGVLSFIFSSFWIWLGFAALVLIVAGGLGYVIKALRSSREITIHEDGAGRRTVEIKNASGADMDAVIGLDYVDADESDFK